MELVAVLKRTPRRVELSLSEAIQLDRHDWKAIQTKSSVSDRKSCHGRSGEHESSFATTFGFSFSH